MILKTIRPKTFCYQCGRDRTEMGTAFGAFHDAGNHYSPKPQPIDAALRDAMNNTHGKTIAQAMGYDSTDQLVRDLHTAGVVTGLRVRRWR